jgi:hypothetical protein
MRSLGCEAVFVDESAEAIYSVELV